jgi:putative (di)nucleoside polyphosphate hydrolase
MVLSSSHLGFDFPICQARILGETPGISMPTSLTGIFRENVAALLLRRDGRLLIGECADKPGCWSFPQGGVDDGETRREALFREMREEVRLGSRGFEVLASRSGYTYSYPPGRLKKGIYRGQIQTYFLCRLLRGEPDPGGSNPRAPEFLRLRWVKPEEFDLALIPVFKREVTSRVLMDFFGVSPAPLPESLPDAMDNDPEVML